MARQRGLDAVYGLAIDAREATLLGGVRVMPVPTVAALAAPRHVGAPLTLAPEGEDLAAAAGFETAAAEATPAAPNR